MVYRESNLSSRRTIPENIIIVLTVRSPSFRSSRVYGYSGSGINSSSLIVRVNFDEVYFVFSTVIIVSIVISIRD